MKLAPAMAAAAAALLAGCASQPVRPLPPLPVPQAVPAPAPSEAWRPYAAPLPPAVPAPEAPVDRAPLPDLGAAPALAEAEAFPAPGPAAGGGFASPGQTAGSGDGTLAAPRPDRPYAARTRSTWGGRAVPRDAGPAPAAPKPYTPPTPSAERLAGGRVVSPWADAAVPGPDRSAFEAAVRAAASGGDGSWTSSDGEAFSASRVAGGSGRCVSVEVVGTRPGEAGITRRGSAQACPR